MILYENPWFRVVKSGIYHFVEEISGTSGGAAVLPIIGDRLLLLEMNRVSQGMLTLELPRGFADPGEDPISCAIRELREETGLIATKSMVKPLGFVRPNTGILRSRVQLFAVNLPEATFIGERDDEACRIIMLPLSDLDHALISGRIEDGFTLSALSLFAAHQRQSWPCLEIARSGMDLCL